VRVKQFKYPLDGGMSECVGVHRINISPPYQCHGFFEYILTASAEQWIACGQVAVELVANEDAYDHGKGEQQWDPDLQFSLIHAKMYALMTENGEFR
jgi:hypothetical protein